MTKEFVTVEFLQGEEVFSGIKNIPFGEELHKSLLKNPKIIDVSAMLYAPETGDFWDFNTSMYIPNYINRSRKMALKTHAELVDWAWFICVDPDGNVILTIRVECTPDNWDTIEKFKSSPKIRVV